MMKCVKISKLKFRNSCFSVKKKRKLDFYDNAEEDKMNEVHGSERRKKERLKYKQTDRLKSELF